MYWMGHGARPLRTSEGGHVNTGKSHYRFRPAWHRWVGVVTLILGLYVVFANDLMRLADGVQLLPGGHSELYLLAGVGISAGSLWWFGWLDSRTKK